MLPQPDPISTKWYRPTSNPDAAIVQWNVFDGVMPELNAALAS